MKKHYKKMIAPIIITVLFIIYFTAYFGFLIFILDGFLKWFLGAFPAVTAVLMIAVCIDRIKEIRSGEEDDLSKY